MAKMTKTKYSTKATSTMAETKYIQSLLARSRESLEKAALNNGIKNIKHKNKLQLAREIDSCRKAWRNATDRQTKERARHKSETPRPVTHEKSARKSVPHDEAYYRELYAEKMRDKYDIGWSENDGWFHFGMGEIDDDTPGFRMPNLTAPIATCAIQNQDSRENGITNEVRTKRHHSKTRPIPSLGLASRSSRPIPNSRICTQKQQYK
jgi:hypothetical protein